MLKNMYKSFISKNSKSTLKKLMYIESNAVKIYVNGREYEIGFYLNQIFIFNVSNLYKFVFPVLINLELCFTFNIIQNL